jgi:amino acid transporter
LLTVVVCILTIAGAKILKYLLYMGWSIAAVGLVSMWAMLLTTNPTVFAAKWDSFFANSLSYQGVIDLAKGQGWSWVEVTVAGSIAAVPIASLFHLGGANANVIAGEIRNVRRALPIALTGSLIGSLVLWSLCAQSTLMAVGEQWMSAVGFLFDNAPGAYFAAMPFAPSQILILSLLAYPNQLLIAWFTFVFLVSTFPVLFLYFFFPSRYFFAWAFDRIIPTKLADVGHRFRTPHSALIVNGIVSVILLALFYFAGFAQAYTEGVFVIQFAWAVIATVTIFFPWKRPDLLEQAPTFMKKKIAGVPVFSYIAAITAILFYWIAFLAYTNPFITVATTLGTGMMVGIVVGGVAIYYASLWYHRRKGIDMTLAFQEIPPV